MEQIRLSEEELCFLSENYPGLTYDKTENKIKGVFSFHRSYKGKTLKGVYSIEFKLEHSKTSILPKVRETCGKILNIAKRKNINPADIHLNSLEGDLCLILGIKEKAVYPDGFDFKLFMNHIETHLYWVTYFERYDEKPWEDEPHNIEEALIKAVKENKLYRKDYHEFLEKKLMRKLGRSVFRNILRKNKML